MQTCRMLLKSAVPVLVDWTPLRSQAIFRLPEPGQVVALTFDDGPDPIHTPQLLDTLAAAGCKATFFLVGSRIKGQSDILRRIANEGHTIGNHTYSHINCSKLSWDKVVQQLVETDLCIEDAGARPSNLFRPPWGKLTPLQVWRLLRAGRRLAYWSLASDDHILAPGQVAERCVRARPRDVILLHDRIPLARKALPAVLDALAAKGLKTVTLADAEVP